MSGSSSGGSASSGEKGPLSVVFVGGTTAGKSSLLGRLLVDCGWMSPAQFQGLREDAGEDAEERVYAWVVDRMPASRDRGITIDLSVIHMESLNHRLTLMDAPGMRDFLRNCLTGLASADAIVLVVSASPGEFEAELGNGDGSVVREHALMAFTFGVRQVRVVVNKMETVRAAAEEGQGADADADAAAAAAARQERFKFIQERVRRELQDIGYNMASVQFLPASALQGANITEPSPELLPWFEGSTLLQSLDSLYVPQRPTKDPLRVAVRDVYKIGGIGTVVVGKVLSGVLRGDVAVTVSPCGLPAHTGNLPSRVQRLERARQLVEEVGAGEECAFHLEGLTARDIRRGAIVGDPGDHPPRCVRSFTARVRLQARAPVHVLPGYTPVLDVHFAHVPVRVTGLLRVLHPKTGKTLEEAPAQARNGQTVVLSFVPMKPLCLEAQGERFESLSRFLLRDMRITVGVGVVLEAEFVEQEEEEEEEEEGRQKGPSCTSVADPVEVPEEGQERS